MSESSDWASQPPPVYTAPPYGQSGYTAYGGYDGDGAVGRVRPTGISILLFIVTFGIYGYIYNYQVHSEMKRYSGRGIGGGIALLLTLLAGIAMPFVTPAEVGSLYAMRGQRPPVNGWTGLWVVLPSIGGYFLFFILIVSSLFVSSGNSSSSGVATGIAVALVIALLAAVITCLVMWFVKTNGALNDFWASLGAVA